ncbi:MAG: hypothetical protein R3C52_01350 [Hyphomonadaceae bacterium]
MSLQECTRALSSGHPVRINAGDYSQAELEEAAAAAQLAGSKLVLFNLKGRSTEDIGRILQAGGQHIRFGDIYLV